jgi:hypothetical protein
MRAHAALAVVALAAVGCFSHPVTIVDAATPNPFVGRKRFVLLPVDHAGVGVTMTRGFKEPNEGRQLTDLNAAVQAFEAKFEATMIERAHELDYEIVPAESAPPDAFTIRPHLDAIGTGVYEVQSMGMWTRRAKGASSATVRVEIVAPGGARDEVTASHEQDPNIMFSTAEARSEWDGFQCALAIAEHVKRRIDE